MTSSEVLLTGTIVKGIGGFYYVHSTAGEQYTIRAKGKFRKLRVIPMVGDSIVFSPGQNEEHGWIEEILPRKSELIRPAVANIESLLLVIAPEPQPDLLLIDTLLVTALKQNIRPTLIINKCDLDASLYGRICAEYRSSGFKVLQTSSETGEGLPELQKMLSEGISCFAGQSGVGKSTLIAKATGLTLETGEISRKIQRGKHTTRHVELLKNGPYQVLDTPGFSLLELWDDLEPGQLKEYYPEFRGFEGLCRFSPCYHFSEPDCAVLQAVQDGNISSERMERYHILLKKVQEQWRNRYD